MIDNICPECGDPLLISGVLIGTGIKFYKCFDCNYELEDRTEEKLEYQVVVIPINCLPEVLIETKNIKL